jgi:peptidoglycan LD-endopeptidase CwlK
VVLRRLVLLLLLLLLPSFPAAAYDSLPSGLRALLAAYPGEVCGAGRNTLRWCDGTVLTFDDGRKKTFDTLLKSADLEDQLHLSYPAGPAFPTPPPRDFDPGRFRNEAFFRKMYGADRAAVEKNLVPVAWPFGQPTTLLVTRINRVNEKLAAVIRDLQRLPPALRTYLEQPAGGYCWRPIAGTDRLSPHSFGIAVDLGGPHVAYWRWDAKKNGGHFAWRNQIPWPIVAAFERHGFIWGGKWNHYDTMHFEYRPELFPLPPTERKPR